MRKVKGLREDKIRVAVYKHENLSTTLLYELSSSSLIAFDLKISDGISTATSTR